MDNNKIIDILESEKQEVLSLVELDVITQEEANKMLNKIDSDIRLLLE